VTLHALINNRCSLPSTTVTPATSATQKSIPASSVAEVATVTVAHGTESSILLLSEEIKIRECLSSIEENDLLVIEETVSKCCSELITRSYYLDLSERHKQNGIVEKRRSCAQCTNLMPSGVCLAARRGEIKASSTYRPILNILRRCSGYMPTSDDHDRRTGNERWSSMKAQKL